MKLSDAINGFRARLAEHCGWMAMNHQRINEMTHVLDTLEKVDAEQQDDAIVVKWALKNILRVHRGETKVVYQCETWQTSDPIAYFQHVIECPFFRASMLDRCICPPGLRGIPTADCCDVEMDEDLQICPKCHDHAVPVYRCPECGAQMPPAVVSA